MFRAMRRIRQQLSEEESREILEKCNTCILAVSGDDGYPYTVPMNYVYADGKIYFHGAKTGHKADAIRRSDKVSVCVVSKEDVVPEKLTTYFKSVVAFGRARILEDDAEIVAATKAICLKYSDDAEAADREIEKQLRALCVVELTIEHMTGKEAIELTRARG